MGDDNEGLYISLRRKTPRKGQRSWKANIFAKKTDPGEDWVIIEDKDILKDIENIKQKQNSMDKALKDLNNAHENWMNKAKNQQKDLEEQDQGRKWSAW